MKAIKNTLTTVALIFGILLGYANGDLSKGDYIKVSDSQGEIIYSGNANYNGSLKTHFDFSELDNGTYIVEVEKDFEIEITTVVVDNKLVSFMDNELQRVLKPVIRTENDKVIVSKIKTASEDFTVKLYFEDELIYTENVTSNNTLVNKTYKLDKSQKGDYNVVITSNNRVFTKRFTF